MKKGMMLVAFVLFFALTSVVEASTCSYKEAANLNTIASNIKATYEVKVGVLDPSTYSIPDTEIDEVDESNYSAEYKYFDINITNITSEVYLTITSEDKSINMRVGYSDTKDGIYTFKWENLLELSKITIKVHASNKTGCSGDELRAIYLSLPKNNPYATSLLCEDSKEFYLCQELITFNEPDYNTFEKKIADYKAGSVSITGDPTENPTEDRMPGKREIIIVGGILVVGVVAVITLGKKRRKADEKD